MRRFRILNKWWAWLFGYFWLPCPLCGEYFGGHEVPFIIYNNKVCCYKHHADPVKTFYGEFK